MKQPDDPGPEARDPHTDKGSRTWLWVGYLMVMFALGLLMTFCSPVRAQDPTGKYFNSPWHGWFDAQINSKGESCCLEADAHDYVGDYSIRPDGSVDLTINDRAVNIAAGKVIWTAEPVGMNKALLWYAGSFPGPGTTYYYFHPASLT